MKPSERQILRKQEISARLLQADQVKSSAANLRKLVWMPTFALVFLYAFGYSFHTGFFAALGIDPDYFPRTLDIQAAKGVIGMILSVGLVKTSQITILIQIIAISSVLLFVLGFLIYWTLHFIRPIRFSNQMLKLSTKSRTRQALFISLTVSILPSALFVSFVFFLLVLIVALVPHDLGRAVAAQILKENLTVDCETKDEKLSHNRLNDCITVTNASNSISGIQLAASNEAVALLTTESVIVMGLKESYKIVRWRDK